MFNQNIYLFLCVQCNIDLVPFGALWRTLILSTSRITFNNHHIPFPLSPSHQYSMLWILPWTFPCPSLLFNNFKHWSRKNTLKENMYFLSSRWIHQISINVFFTIRKIMYLLLLLMLTLATFSFCSRRTWWAGGQARLYPCLSLEERACWPLYWP